jgi:hypothetical protein
MVLPVFGSSRYGMCSSLFLAHLGEMKDPFVRGGHHHENDGYRGGSGILHSLKVLPLVVIKVSVREEVLV